MDKNALIVFLTLVIVLLLVLIAYLMGMENQPQREPEPLPEFPADEILEEIRKDFDELFLKWEARDREKPSESRRLTAPSRKKPDTEPRERTRTLIPEQRNDRSIDDDSLGRH